MEIPRPALAGDQAVDRGETAFKLHDTYGFPLDLTADVCRERGVTVDEAGFEAAMNRQREAGARAGKFKMAAGLEYDGAATTFHGYEHLVRDTAKVTALYVDVHAGRKGEAGDDVVIVLDHTPFYAERRPGRRHRRAAQRRRASVGRRHDQDPGDVHGHHGRIVEGEVEGRRRFVARVDAERARQARCATTAHAPDAQGAARGARAPRAAEGLAGGMPSARASTSRTTRR